MNFKLSYDIEVITKLDQLKKIEKEWHQLYENTAEKNFFFSYDWIVGWSQAFLGKNKLFILAVHQNDQLVGLAPFYIIKKFNLRVVQFLGLKGVNGENVTILATKELFSQVIEKIFCFLLKNKNDWDAMSFYGVRGNSLFQEELMTNCASFMKQTKIISTMLGVALLFISKIVGMDISQKNQKAFVKRIGKQKSYSVSAMFQLLVSPILSIIPKL